MSCLRTSSVILVFPVIWVAFGAGSALAESMDCSGSKVSKERSSYEVIRPGDRPDLELRQYIRVDVISSNNPEFDGTETTVYQHEDLNRSPTGGASRHIGYGNFALKNGEKLWFKFEGVAYWTSTGGTWEAHYQGIAHFIGGTGKYKAVRGGYHYQGTATPAGLKEDFVCSATY